MRRRRVPLLALATAACLAPATVSAARPGAEHAATAATSSRLQVIELEYRLSLSRGAVKAGPVSLEAIDRGMDPHDLRLRKLASQREIALPELTSGRRWDGVVRLRPGVYYLWCSLPEHAKLGMHATLKVVH